VSKLQAKWKGPRRVVSVESDFVLVVGNLLTKELKAAHATRLRFYNDNELNVAAELAQAAEHNDHQLYVVSKILDARYNEQEMFHKLLVAWRGFPVGEATWEPYSVMAVEVPEMVAKFMESHDETDMVRKLRSLESSHGEVLCDATNETSVSDMLCRDNKEVCMHCKEYNIEDTWRSQEEAEPGESPDSGQSLLDIIWSSSRTPDFPGHPFGPRSFLFHA
jgi:Chromo (CHRromatin Organisation MOdifier) domain